MSSFDRNAAWMVAKIQATYPDAWSETVRGLMIHSSEWMETMKEHFFTGLSNRARYLNSLRTCGYGVPNLDKALYCKNNSLTLIAQEQIQPFDKKENGSGYRTKDMHFCEFPCPQDVLLELGEIPVKMRVTLSYFIEPSPNEVGWKDRYRYRSHGLKFDVKYTDRIKRRFC